MGGLRELQVVREVSVIQIEDSLEADTLATVLYCCGHQMFSLNSVKARTLISGTVSKSR